MSEKKYLYGASIQGIQGFIFKTNKLKEIVGASTLVEEITNAESTFPELNLQSGEKVMTAAGNIRYKLDEETCKKVVYLLPKLVANYAPGITISQAVVPISEEGSADRNELEKRLRTQRNKPVMPIDIGYMGLERARRTGGVGVEYKEEVLDRATQKKIKTREEDTVNLFEKATGTTNIKKSEVAFNIEDITKGVNNSWLAIIHADGNSIGNKIRDLSEDQLKDFSVKLEDATKSAAKKAFDEVVPKFNSELKRYPIRPVILGGDDLTVIIRADLAFDYTVAYLKAFEEATKEKLGQLTSFQNGLTACAGISYIKDSYPFHYGVKLAEDLTKEAKKMSKEINKDLPPSSLSFYKVQSSFTDGLEAMRQRTHQTIDKLYNFNYGPYLILENNGKACVNELRAGMEVIDKHSNDKSKGVSKLRQWLTMLHQDPSKAGFLMDRIKKVNSALYNELKLEDKGKKNILYDLIQLHSLK